MTIGGTVARARFWALQALPHKYAFICGLSGSIQHLAQLSQGYIKILSNAHSKQTGRHAGTLAKHCHDAHSGCHALGSAPQLQWLATL